MPPFVGVVSRPGTKSKTAGLGGRLSSGAFPWPLGGALVVSFQQVVHPAPAEEADVVETSTILGEPNGHP